MYISMSRRLWNSVGKNQIKSKKMKKKKQKELDMEQWTSSKLGKEYIKAVYCHPAF